jgi:peroxiredoxin
MPSLNRLYRTLKDKGIQVLAVSIDASDTPVREFVIKNNIVFSILHDRDKEVFFDQYAGPSLPATYLIDRNGIIVEKFIGPREWDTPDMKNRILKLLDKR